MNYIYIYNILTPVDNFASLSINEYVKLINTLHTLIKNKINIY